MINVISVIICSIDEDKLARVIRNYTTLLHGEVFEIVVIRDARSLSEGYNRGIQQSNGSILIFSHDDIEILSPDFVVKLKKVFASNDVIGVIGASVLADARWITSGQPYIHGVVVYPPGAVGNVGYLVNVFGAKTPVISGIQGLDGLFVAAKREVVERVGFDEQAFDGFHCYDTDFTFSAYLSGFKVAVCTEIIIAHQSVGKFGDAWQKYNARFMAKHQTRLYGGERGGLRCAALQARSVEAVLNYCEPARLAEITAKLRGG